MPTRIDELSDKLEKENEGFAKVKQLHEQLAQRVDEMEAKPHLTPQEEVELKTLKKKKLASKDEMEKILQQHR